MKIILFISLFFSTTCYSQKTITIFGDSKVEGVGASVPAKRWATLLSISMGYTEDNRGLSATNLEKRAPINYANSPNMVDNMTTIPFYSTLYSFLIIDYGINDVGYTIGSYTPANYTTDYISIINHAINVKGWPSLKIVAIAPCYATNAGYALYAGYAGNVAPTAARHLAFNDSTQSVATQKNTLFLNLYTPMQLNGGSSLLTDGLHMNDAGNLFYANAVEAYLRSNISTGILGLKVL